MERFTNLLDRASHGLELASQFIQGIPGHEWYIAGLIVGSIPVTVWVVNLVKKHHVKQTAEKLKSEFIVLNVAFWSFILTALTFLLAIGPHIANFFPYLTLHWPQIASGAIAFHAVATAVKKWWTDRKNNKPLVDLNTTDETSQTVPAPEPQKNIDIML